MWFKNLRLYRLPAPWNVSLTDLESWLARYPFQPCGNMDLQSRGWLAPTEAGTLIHSVGGQWIISLGIDHKLLPAAVINQVAQERAQEIEAQQGYAPGRKQLREIKERVADELLPRAFSRRYRTWAWIDPTKGWLCVDAASPGKADELLEMLGKSADELPLSLVKTELSPASAMADWLASGEAPSGFTIDRDCELKSPAEDKAAVRYVRHPLEGDEIRKHLAEGKQPTRLALTWDDRISFILTDQLEVKRLAFLDILKEEAEKQAEHASEQFDANIALMTGELSRLIPELIAALGGELPAAQ